MILAGIYTVHRATSDTMPILF